MQGSTGYWFILFYKITTLVPLKLLCRDLGDYFWWSRGPQGHQTDTLRSRGACFLTTPISCCRVLIGKLLETTFRNGCPCIFYTAPISCYLRSSSEACLKPHSERSFPVFLQNPYSKLLESSSETCWKPHSERGFPACFETSFISCF